MKALSEVDPDRKCFRLIGGFLYEKTVKDVLPALEKRRIEVIIYYILILKLSMYYIVMFQTVIYCCV